MYNQKINYYKSSSFEMDKKIFKDLKKSFKERLKKIHNFFDVIFFYELTSMLPYYTYHLMKT